MEQALASGGVTPDQLQELTACGGFYDFRVESNRLLCADGSAIPSVALQSPGTPLTGRDAIVFHYTGSPDNSFVATARFLAEGRLPAVRGPLAHLLISRTGAVVQIAPLDVMARHVGASQPWRGRAIGNSNSIGVEMINRGSSDQPYTAAQVAAAKGIARALVRDLGIGVIVGHSDLAPGRRADPGPHFPMREVREAAGLSPD